MLQFMEFCRSGSRIQGRDTEETWSLPLEFPDCNMGYVVSGGSMTVPGQRDPRAP